MGTGGCLCQQEEDECCSLFIIKTICAFPFQEVNNSLTELGDNYLGHLYPDYYAHCRPVLMRQLRDLLLCTYLGDLRRLEEEFLAPAANLICLIKEACDVGQVSLTD